MANHFRFLILQSVSRGDRTRSRVPSFCMT